MSKNSKREHLESMNETEKEIIVPQKLKVKKKSSNNVKEHVKIVKPKN